MKTQNRVLNILFYLSILLFFLGFNFTDNPPSGWYFQTLPNLNSRPISDIIFLDSLIGYSITSYVANDTAYILKTTNGGDNWNIIFKQPTNVVGGFNRIQFINQQTGFACGNFLWKTTNEGMNWFNVNTTGIFPQNMFVLNQDTIWITDSDPLTGGVFRTTNGGLTWTQQLSSGNQNPDKIYMFNARIGFICKASSNAYFRKTTDGGNSWFTLISNESFRNIEFIDSLTGWRAWGNNMYKTENGGLNWITQPLPSGGILITSGIYEFSNINKDTIWGSGGYVYYGSGGFRGVVYRTTNGGNNWYYQIPDTAIHIFQYYHLSFDNKNIGWAYSVYNGIHTITGGDTTFLTPVTQISSEIPKDYLLYQNYPNPFNATSKIKYKISRHGGSSTSLIKIKVFDIIGKEVATLSDKRISPGTYESTFEANNLPSGMYFYSLIVDGKVVDTKKAVLLK